MKNVRSLIFGFVIFTSCNMIQTKSAGDKIKLFIAGTYIRNFVGEYAKGNDTLVIEQPDLNNNYYLIQHKISYQQILNKQLLPVTYKIENWIAIFNDQTNVLMEQKKGKMISFLPGENALLLGNSKFKKIK